MAELSEVSDAEWQELATKRVFFGHQSVGGNIMDGVAAVLEQNPRIRLHVAETTAIDSMLGPGLYHARIGRNRFPESKAAEFASVTDATLPSIAMLKFCYVDVSGATDPDSLFAEYRRNMVALKARHPGIVVIHSTMPLTVADGAREWLREKFRGDASRRSLNVIRNRYNDLLRAEYGGKEPIFDIATIESTLSDGSRTFFTRGGRPIYHLAPVYSSDGSHLNAEGERRAAERFLALLAKL